MKPPAVCFIPQVEALRSSQLPGAAVAVIDLLRATTTITAILAAGATGVVPCASEAQARIQAEQFKRKRVPIILAGERGGLRIPGFDFGNSPLEFDRRVRGRRVILATSNGTRALATAAEAPFVIAACLNNLDAAARALLRRREKRMVILAAGEEGGRSEEDNLAAGLLLREILRRKAGDLLPERDLNEPARAVLAMAKGCSSAAVGRAVAASPHGRQLTELGFGADVRTCARINTTRTVGRLSGRGVLKKL